MEISKERISVWFALSEFYLDTELDDADHERIFQVLKNSGFKLPELKDIDLYEVFPVLQANLLSIAGEWAGFDAEWLKERCTDCFKKKNRPFFKWKCKMENSLFYSMRRRHWIAIELKWQTTF